MMKTMVRALISWTLQLNNMQSRLILDQKASKFPSNSKFYDSLFLGLLTKEQEKKKKQRSAHISPLCMNHVPLFWLGIPILRDTASCVPSLPPSLHL